mmetsp:Transcript_17313/g.29847  ORF Transcript_17313/g.29847 Transcript_17313/m.29847 type:complete len:203 (+) Transcript_17313:1018-1626(+)
MDRQASSCQIGREWRTRTYWPGCIAERLLAHPGHSSLVGCNSPDHNTQEGCRSPWEATWGITLIQASEGDFSAPGAGSILTWQIFRGEATTEGKPQQKDDSRKEPPPRSRRRVRRNVPAIRKRRRSRHKSGRILAHRGAPVHGRNPSSSQGSWDRRQEAIQWDSVVAWAILDSVWERSHNSVDKFPFIARARIVRVNNSIPT